MSSKIKNIRTIEKKDQSKVVELVFQLNNQNTFYSGYCPKQKSSIEKEVTDSIENQTAFIYEDKDIFGVMMFFITPLDAIDVSGPYVVNANLQAGQALIKALKMSYPRKKINFFFSSKSTYYQSLMDHFNINLKDHEYILKLYPENFTPTDKDIEVRKANIEDQNEIIRIHESLFSDTYISNDMLLSSDRFNNIHVLINQGHIAGFSLIQPYDTHAYIELFCIRKEDQGKKLSKPFLSKLIKNQFKDDASYCMLVVDKINELASRLYFNLGFEIDEENLSYVDANK